MNGKNLCFVDDISQDELLGVLYALPPSVRAKTFWSFGYCKACPASLKLVARNANDPKFEVPPSQMAYTTSDIETILTEILDVKQEALTAVIGEGIGKSSLTPEFTQSVNEALEARELVKISVLKNCLDDPREMASMIAERTKSEVVQVIGRKIVFYRPSKEHKKIELPK